MDAEIRIFINYAKRRKGRNTWGLYTLRTYIKIVGARRSWRATTGGQDHANRRQYCFTSFRGFRSLVHRHESSSHRVLSLITERSPTGGNDKYLLPDVALGHTGVRSRWIFAGIVRFGGRERGKRKKNQKKKGTMKKTRQLRCQTIVYNIIKVGTTCKTDSPVNRDGI